VPLIAGHTFLYDLKDATPHLWIVSSNPDGEGNFLVVSLTSLKGNKDQTVMLHGGEHPFLKWGTCAAYIHADIMTVERLQALISSGNAKMKEPLADDKTKLILDGFTASDFTKKRVREFARAYKSTYQSSAFALAACSDRDVDEAIKKQIPTDDK
jgi:hypothetical protein